VSRQYWFLWTAAMSSALGSTMAGLAYPLVVLGLTGSPGQAGLMAGYQAGFALACAPLAGALVDRWDRRRILIVTDAAMGLAAASVAVALGAGHLTIVQLYGVATVGAVGTAFAGPCRQAVLRSIIPPQQFAQAFAREEARTHGVSLVGPPIGGFLYTVGRFLPFVADAVSFLLSLGFVLAARVPRRLPLPDAAMSEAPASSGPGSPVVKPAARPSLRAELAEAVRWLAKERFLCAAVMFALFVNLIEMATQLPVITLIRARGGSAATLGLVLACGGVGGLLGALAAPRLGRLLPPGRLLLAVGWCLAALTGALALPFGVYWPGAVLCLAMLVIPGVNVALGTVVFTATPPAMQGRISSLLGMATMASASVAPLLGGTLAGGVGPAASLTVLGVLLVLVCAIGTVPHVLRAASIPAAADHLADAAAVAAAAIR